MNYWLCIISDYTSITVLLCNKTDIIETLTIDKSCGNQRLILCIDATCIKHQLTLQDMDFIGVNVGPGPYTSLRVAIATANGLSFASKIPLVAIDGLKALLYQYQSKNYATVALLNAFNNEVFYGIHKKDLSITTGYAPLTTIPSIIQDNLKEPFMLVGNGVELYKEKLHDLIVQACVPIPISSYAGLQTMVNQAYQSWQQKQTTHELFPSYLKELTYINSIKVAN